MTLAWESPWGPIRASASKASCSLAQRPRKKNTSPNWHLVRQPQETQGLGVSWAWYKSGSWDGGHRIAGHVSWRYWEAISVLVGKHEADRGQKC